MLNPRLTRLELPGRREQYDGLIQFALSAAAQALAGRFRTASRLTAPAAALSACTDKTCAARLGEHLAQLVDGLVRGEYSACVRKVSKDTDKEEAQEEEAEGATPGEGASFAADNSVAIPMPDRAPRRCMPMPGESGRFARCAPRCAPSGMSTLLERRRFRADALWNADASAPDIDVDKCRSSFF
jgi:hypothetical protein